MENFGPAKKAVQNLNNDPSGPKSGSSYEKCLSTTELLITYDRTVNPVSTLDHGN